MRIKLLPSILSRAFVMVSAGLCMTPGAGLLRAQGVSSSAAVLRQDFEQADLTDWEFTDPAAWRIVKEGRGENHVLEQFRESKYQPPFRSPLNVALLKVSDVEDFVMDVQVRSTGRDYGHRDLCIFFGHEDPAHFYYVHFGKEADAHANSVFLVNGKDRVSIAETRTKGTPWTNGWHHVRLTRSVADGAIKVYFDDMELPAMVAHDKTFKHGRIGVGSFDDTGMFDGFKLSGKGLKSSAQPLK